MLRLFATAALLAATPALAQQAAPPAPATASTVPVPAARTGAPIRVLFIGNSFTQGAHSALRNWHAGTVTDLNRAGYGGVPALFKAFADQAGLRYDVSLETQGGKTLGFHFDERRHLFDQSWDVVVLQELSTLSRAQPGDTTDYIRDVGRLTQLLRARNPRVRIELMATWSRADLVYRGAGRWTGRPIATMALDLRAAADRARAAVPGVSGVLPVGEAWNRAFARGIADPNPYDGVTFGQADLWSYDQYHASVSGYYLEALIVFGQLTGIDPRTLGRTEASADELGLSGEQAAALQAIASEQLASSGQETVRRR